jgi:hypothetical protein
MRSRRRQRILSVLAFSLLAFLAAVAGRALVHRIDVGRHVASPVPPGADYYPFLLAGLKLAVALLLARLAWRAARARATELAASRVLVALGRGPSPFAPRFRLSLSPRLWAGFFVATSCMYLVQADAERAAAGRAGLLDPWLHTSALPVLAVLAVLLSLLWSGVQRWLSEYERLAAEAAAQARRLLRPGREPSPRSPRALDADSPRRLFGLVFESRPPPSPAC